ncbi:MAG: hypothetical protein PHN56_03620 [Candidatus Nanoarchaeia archaeon]|nr:hypothetical protein [Candidatus Nanoarchaeia archaeon]
MINVKNNSFYDSLIQKCSEFYINLLGYCQQKIDLKKCLKLYSYNLENNYIGNAY